MAPLLNRLRKEWRELCKHNKASLSMYNLLKHLPLPEGPEIEAGLRNNFAETDIILFPHNDETLTEWVAFVNGPPDTPFQGARFQLKIQIPSQYPHAPPSVSFVTPICHPNVHFKTGEICLDLLKDNWTPSWALESVCRAIIALMSSPEASSPLNCDAGNLLRANDIRGYWALARMSTLEYAEILPTSTPKAPVVAAATIVSSVPETLAKNDEKTVLQALTTKLTNTSNLPEAISEPVPEPLAYSTTSHPLTNNQDDLHDDEQ